MDVLPCLVDRVSSPDQSALLAGLSSLATRVSKVVVSSAREANMTRADESVKWHLPLGSFGKRERIGHCCIIFRKRFD